MNPTDLEVQLSEAGQQRRGEMLAALQSEMVALHRRRRRRRTCVAGGAVILLAVAIVIGTWPTSEQPSESAPKVAVHTPRRPVAIISIVETDDDILERYSVDSSRPLKLVQWLNDELLVAELAAVDPALGLIRVGSRAWVWGPDDRTANP